MTDTPDPKVVKIVGAVLENADVIVSAFLHVRPNPATGFDLSACLAMVQEESGGNNVWGADAWNPEAYPAGLALPVELNEQEVTEADYHAYRAKRNRGLQPQGCGLTQLTSEGYQHSAELAGGCWIPFYNARTGFAILRGLFARYKTPVDAFAAYNGSGPAADAYGARVAAFRTTWQDRLAKVGA